MTKGKKYCYRVLQDDTHWATEIVRRVSARKTVVSKHQGGFATESEAQQWGESELKLFLNNLQERNKRRSR